MLSCRTLPAESLILQYSVFFWHSHQGCRWFQYCYVLISFHMRKWLKTCKINAMNHTSIRTTCLGYTSVFFSNLKYFGIRSSRTLERFIMLMSMSKSKVREMKLKVAKDKDFIAEGWGLLVLWTNVVAVEVMTVQCSQLVLGQSKSKDEYVWASSSDDSLWLSHRQTTTLSEFYVLYVWFMSGSHHGTELEWLSKNC